MSIFRSAQMNFFNSVINFFKDGGFFLYPLALIFVVGVSIAIERYVYLTRETIRNRGLWDELVPALSTGNFKQVVALTQNSKASIATILNYGVARVASARRRDDIEKAMDESLLEVIPRIEKRTHYLSSLANVGLLIGLLGTITGLIGAFSAVATANPAEKASLLAAAISVAMNNTASGLGVACVDVSVWEAGRLVNGGPRVLSESAWVVRRIHARDHQGREELNIVPM